MNETGTLDIGYSYEFSAALLELPGDREVKHADPNLRLLGSHKEVYQRWVCDAWLTPNKVVEFDATKHRTVLRRSRGGWCDESGSCGFGIQVPPGRLWDEGDEGSAVDRQQRRNRHLQAPRAGQTEAS